jgi:hypothetical protein
MEFDAGNSTSRLSAVKSSTQPENKKKAEIFSIFTDTIEQANQSFKALAFRLSNLFELVYRQKGFSDQLHDWYCPTPFLP